MIIDRTQQIELAQNLLKTVRHAAYATVNEDGTPHNTPLMLVYNKDLTKLYVGSYSDSKHSKNIVRAGKAFAVLYDSFTKGQGGVYITCDNGHECLGEELIEALVVHNSVRTRQGSQPIPLDFYQQSVPAQRMYCLNIEKIEIYSQMRNEDGLIVFEERVAVDVRELREEH